METTFVCYCFQHSVTDIEQDVLRNGRSTIMEQITSASRQGRCQCAVKNPKGR